MRPRRRIPLRILHVRYREEAWPVGEPVAMAEWPENKMNETNRRAKVVVKYAGGERPGERVFQVGEKGPRKADGRDGSADGRYSERSDIHSFLVTARCSQECSSRLLFSPRRVSDALVRFIPFYINRSGFLSFLSRRTDHRHRPPTRFVRDCDREEPVRTV